jgi:hypothetical protein
MNDQKQASNFVKAVKLAVRKATEAVSKLKLGKPEGTPAATSSPAQVSNTSLSPETKSVKPEVAQPASKPAVTPTAAPSEAELREAQTKRLIDNYLTDRAFKDIREVGSGATQAEVAADVLKNMQKATDPATKARLTTIYKFLATPATAAAAAPAAAESVAKPASPEMLNNADLAKEIFKGNYSKSDEFNKMFAPVTVEDIKNLDNRITAGVASQLSWVNRLDESSIRRLSSAVITRLSKTIPLDKGQKQIITTIFSVIANSKKDKAKPVASKPAGK